MLRRLIFPLLLLLPLQAAAQQQLGQKVLGAVGINAGVQPEVGLYVIDKLLFYNSGTIRDRNGDEVPIRGLDVDVVATVLGLGYTFKPKHAPYFTVSAGVPLASVSLSTDVPLASVDRAGFGDAIVQPLRVGWRAKHYDVVGSYTMYIPTGQAEPRGTGIGRGFWTHQLSLGGAAYPHRDRTRRISALLSYDINGWKRDIDIKRGNTLQVQGGAGIVLKKMLLVGVAGFALWQVTDDRGRDVPPAVRGARTRVFGLGPEIDFTIPQTPLAFEARYEWELGTRARVEGDILVIGLTYRAWQPRSARPAAPPRR